MQNLNIWGNIMSSRFDEVLDRRKTDCYKWDKLSDSNMLPFWIADSDYKTFSGIKDKLIERCNHEAYAYTFPGDSYYKTVIKWFKETKGVNLKKDWIVPFSGVVTALYLMVSLFTKKKDTVTISTPVYNPFYDVINGNKRQILCNKLIEDGDTYKIDFKDLDEKLAKSKMFILCNPHNPVGRSFTKDELDEIVRLCKKNNVILVVDEIHGDIIMKDSKFRTIINYFNDYNKIIVCTAPSKTFNIAGIQSANIIIKNKSFREKFTEMINSASMGTPNLFALVACEEAYKNGKSWMEEQNEYLTNTRDYVYKFFKENIPKAKVYKLEATYLMWINLKYLKLSQDELLQGLEKHGVLLNSGTKYSEDFVGYVRLNIACPFEQVKDGLNRIKKFVEECEK